MLNMSLIIYPMMVKNNENLSMEESYTYRDESQAARPGK